MADAPLNALSFVGIDKPTLSYRTNTSPIDESPHWVSGSSNTMATIRGEVEKRPGFALAVETALSVIPGTVQRLYTWRRFSGSFFVMACVQSTVVGSLSQVWKLEVGVDQSFSMIYTDNTSTTFQPFDFTTSNNFCFFGNGTTRQNMRKYNGTAISPTYQSSLWGLDFPIAAPPDSRSTERVFQGPQRAPETIRSPSTPLTYPEIRYRSHFLFLSPLRCWTS